MNALRIGTRGSQLALWQASTVARLIEARTGRPCELVVIRTSGDEKPTEPPDALEVTTASAAPAEPLSELLPDAPAMQSTGDRNSDRSGTSASAGTRTRDETGSSRAAGSQVSAKATFVKEIEDALLDHRVDLAVHSSKDLSAVFPDGLVIGATLPREDPRDAILLPHGERTESVDALRDRLGAHPRLGTSSVRRAAQLRALFPGASVAAIRGNVDTRLRKIDAGECDAGVLACAGLKRLGLASRISLALPLDVCVPAPGQGIVTIQVRDDDQDVNAMMPSINDHTAFDALTAERAIVRALGGGCQMPLGAHARLARDQLIVTAIVIAADGSRVARAAARGPRTQAASLGAQLAESLLREGAADILAS